jgi:CBS domain-containing protein
VVEQTDDRATASSAAAVEVAQTQSMICPVCGFENLQGDDLCANCGADLRTSDIPLATTPFERLLVEVPLATLKTRPPFTVDASATVASVLAKMRDEETADILVTSDGRLVGIFTERDAALKLVGQAAADGRDLASTPISDVMTTDPVVLRGTDSIAVAVQKMAVGGFRHIPLVRDGQPVGVISAADVFRHILHIVE